MPPNGGWVNEATFRRYMASKAKQAGSTAKLADAMGEHRSTVSEVISGRREPTGKVLAYLGLERGYEFKRLPKLPWNDD